MGLFNKIKEILGRIWKFIKKIFRKIVDWTKDILNFFREQISKLISKWRARQLAQKIDDTIEKGDYNKCDVGLHDDSQRLGFMKNMKFVAIKDGNIISNFVYDDKKEEVIFIEDAENIEFKYLDSQTEDAFKRYPMAIFEH